MTIVVSTGVVIGVQGQPVRVEANLRPGIPYFDLVGLAGSALKEARIRVEQAVRSSGFEWPRKRIVLNLAPAELRKEGSALDLALAVACLADGAQFDPQRLAQTLFLGELSLDGQLRPVRGVLPITEAAHKAGITHCVVPHENAYEASLVTGIRVVPCSDLKATCLWLSGGPAPEHEVASAPESSPECLTDWREVRGQDEAKRAAEIALAGGHNLLLTGPPGTGKTLLARCLPSLLPPLQGAELLEVLRIRSVVDGGLSSSVPARPFRAPHHSISPAGLVGGGNPVRPGEVTVAHGGVLFLDELAEFPRAVIESLRQPLEDGELTLTRAGCRMTFPADFIVVSAANPCPCGYHGSSVKGCVCPPSVIQRYQARISGPMLDRIDLQVRMDRPSAELLLSSRSELGATSAEVRQRITDARAMAMTRQGCANAQLQDGLLSHVRALPKTLDVLRRSSDRLGLSPRLTTRLLKVARSIADLALSEVITPRHLAEACSLRALESDPLA